MNAFAEAALLSDAHVIDPFGLTQLCFGIDS